MQCIEKLKKIGLHEINAKTKIATKRLDDIFECRFDDIDRIRVKGFLYILQREYNIDMSEWLEKYDEYYREKEELNKENKDVESKPDNVNISFIDTTVENKTYKKLLIVFIVLLSLFILYFIYNNSSSDDKQTNEVDKYEINTNANIASPDSTIEPKEEEIIISSNATMTNEEEIIISSNATMTNEEGSDISDIIEEQSQSNNKDDNIESIDNNSLIDLSNNTDIIGVEEVIITPKSPLWVGIIDLQTYKKKQVSISDAFNIKLDDSKIIRTGHGYFDIKSPNLSKKYIGGNSKYFIYTRENGFEEITKEEFVEFNRGQEW